MNRFSLSVSEADFKNSFSLKTLDAYRERYNIAPSQQCITVDSEENIKGSAYWGNTPAWANGKPLSSKQTGIFVDKSLKLLQRSKRCAVPADGFYLWKHLGKKELIPYRFMVEDHPVFTFAAAQEDYDDDDGNQISVFRILLDENHKESSFYKTPFPLILTLNRMKEWLNSKEAEMSTFIEESRSLIYKSYSVSPKIENAELDSPQLIRHIPPANQKGNYTLFD